MSFKEPIQLPRMEYTIEEFEMWCILLGHFNAKERLDSFKKFCKSDYCIKEKK